MGLAGKLRIIVLALLCFEAWADPLQVRYPVALDPADQRHLYYAELLQLALSHTATTHSPFALTPVPTGLSQGRVLSMLEHEQLIDVIWTMTSVERENHLRKVPIPLLKGLMGLRLFLIPKGHQQRFNRITSLTELKQLDAGQGYDWPDTDLLKQHGFSLETGPARNLHSMLALGRFAYFPRGILEIWGEEDYHRELQIEQTLALNYSAPVFFFVHKDNHGLALRITQGLEQTLDNGGLDRLLEAHFQWQAIKSKAGLTQRRIFYLDNPLLTQSTQALSAHARYWLLPKTENKLQGTK